MLAQKLRRIAFKVALPSALVAGAFAWEAHAAKPTAAQALQFSPIQSEVEYTKPSAAEVEKCTIAAESKNGVVGWVVRNDGGQILRRFLDTNNDNKVDQWCYYRDGVEIYRDIDADYNGKADQYRWLGTAGSRWALDKDEDGKVDSWKVISAEEVTAEVVAALRDRDTARFRRVLLTETDLESLRLGTEMSADLKKKLTAAATEFGDLAKKQQVVGKGAQWTHFGAKQPGVLPAGTDGSLNDLFVYDNVAAVVESNGKHTQVAIGSLIRVGDCWRVIESPKNLLDGREQGDLGLFMTAALSRKPESSGNESTEPEANETIQKLITELDDVDKQTAKATPSQQPKLITKRADILHQLFNATTDGEQRATWLRQMVDSISAATQAGSYPEGVKRLDSLTKEVADDGSLKSLVPYVKFRHMSSAYTVSLQDPKADYPKIQEKWLADLDAFVKEFPQSQDTAEAMLQLAVAHEFAGQEDDAIRWFGRIVTDFPKADLAKKAAGAKRRLQSVGQPLQLTARTLDGQTIDVSQLKGNVVLIHYWATWCEPCKQDIAELKTLKAKYAKDKLVFLGISLDHGKQAVTDYLKTNRLAWPQVHEDGGLDSRLANELGVLTLPTMILLDKQGKVVNRNLHGGEIDAQLKKLLR